MKIQRTSQTTISPRAREELMYRVSGIFYNASRELRHPVGIYNVTLHNLWGSFIDVLDELDAVLETQSFNQEPILGLWDEKLMRRQERLVSDLMRYFDDCLSLLCCFFPVKHTDLKTDRELVKKQPPVKIAWDAIRPYRNHIANIMNHIKHQQGALRGVVLYNENRVIPGYFVEHVGTENGEAALEPHPDVHPLFRGEHTAFSFFRDLRFNFWLVYAVSEIVADAITQIVQPMPNILEEERSDKSVREVAHRISKLPKWTFKDESLQDFPEVELTNIDGIGILTIEYPSTKTILLSSFGTDMVMNCWISDAVTRCHRFPYFQGKISTINQYTNHRG